MNYKESRQKANNMTKKVRQKIEKITGKKLSKLVEIDHKVSIKKGGSPTNPKNLQLLPRTVNRKKGAK